MPCYRPITAWYSREVNRSGKRSLVFSPRKAEQQDDPIQISCGQCIGCRLERSRQWAVRCLHEASLYEDNCFITLTFDDNHLFKRNNPASLDIRDFQLFMKRLRKSLKKKLGFSTVVNMERSMVDPIIMPLFLIMTSQTKIIFET